MPEENPTPAQEQETPNAIDDAALQDLNSELSALINDSPSMPPSMPEMGNTETSLPDMPSQEDALPCPDDSAKYEEGIEETDFSKPTQLKIFSEIDSIVGNLYKEIGQINSNFEKISSTFFNLAADYEKEAERKGDDGLSTDESKAALILEISGMAINGVRNLINLLKEQNNYNRIMWILQREAETKSDFVRSQLPNLQQMANYNIALLNEELSKEIDLSSPLLNNTASFRNYYRETIQGKLNLLRDSLFHFRLLEYLDRQFEYWKQGQTTEEYIPDFGDINREMLSQYLYYKPLYEAFGYSSDEEMRAKEKAEDIETMEELVQIDGGADKAYSDILDAFGDKKVSARFMPIVMDKQLCATAMYFISEESRNNLITECAYMEDCSIPAQELQCNEAFHTMTKYTEEYNALGAKKSKREDLIVLNGILAGILGAIASFRFIDGFWWSMAAAAVIIGLIIWAANKNINSVGAKYDNKMEKLSLYIQNLMLRLSGENPKTNMLNDVSDSLFKSIGGAVLGALAGLIFCPPWGLILGGILGLALFSGQKKEERKQSDGSEYRKMETGNGWKAYVLMVLLIAGIIGIWFIKR